MSLYSTRNLFISVKSQIIVYKKNKFRGGCKCLRCNKETFSAELRKFMKKFRIRMLLPNFKEVPKLIVIKKKKRWNHFISLFFKNCCRYPEILNLKTCSWKINLAILPPFNLFCGSNNEITHAETSYRYTNI